MTDKMSNPTKDVFGDHDDKTREDRAGDVEFTVSEVIYNPADEFRLVPQSQLDEVIDEGPNHKVIVTADPHYGLYVIKYTLGKVPEALRGKYTSRDQASKAYFRHKAKIEAKNRKK